MVHADLHVHTDNSDGTLALGEVPEAAARAGVAVVAVTDHDRSHPGFDGAVMEWDGVRLVHGIELRVETPDQRVDLLGYGLEPTEALRSEIDRLQRDRRERGRRIVECLEAELGVSLDVPITEGLGRPHIARAVVDHPETAYDSVEPVFRDLIGDDEPCFVPRDVPSFDRGSSLLRDSCSFVGLAHPLRYPDPDTALERCADLDAVERYYPYDRPHGRESADPDGTVDGAIREYDLVPTGGSDAHGTDIGTAGLSGAAYEAVAPRLPDLD